MKIRLLELCRTRGVSLTELARWTGIARVSLSRYAHGVQDMTLRQASKVISSLGCRISDLVDDREDLSSPIWRIAIRRQAAESAHKGDRSSRPSRKLTQRKRVRP